MRIFVYECVTAGGLGRATPPSLLREGHAMLAAVVEDIQRIRGVQVVTLIAEERSCKLGDDCRRVASGREELQFEEIVKECEWTLVIAPEFGNLLADRSRRVLNVGGRLLGSNPIAIQLTGDKLALAKFWRARCTPHPWTDSLDQGDLTRVPPPWVLKPRQGAGSQATYLIEDVISTATIARMDTEAWTRGDFIVQQYVVGQAVSVALLIGKSQTIALTPARQHLSTDGRFRYLGGSLPLPSRLAERATRVALQAVAGIDGLQGYVGVDLVLGDDGQDYAIEINPRLTTSYLGLRQMCEQNLAELMLHCVRGEKIATPAWRAGEMQFDA